MFKLAEPSPHVRAKLFGLLERVAVAEIELAVAHRFLHPLGAGRTSGRTRIDTAGTPWPVLPQLARRDARAAALTADGLSRLQ